MKLNHKKGKRNAHIKRVFSARKLANYSDM